MKYIAKLGFYKFEFDDAMQAITFVVEGKKRIMREELEAEVIIEEEAPIEAEVENDGDIEDNRG